MAAQGLLSRNLQIKSMAPHRTHPFSGWWAHDSCKRVVDISVPEIMNIESWDNHEKIFSRTMWIKWLRYICASLKYDKLRNNSYQVFWQRWSKHYTCNFLCRCIVCIGCNCSYRRLWLGFGPQSPRAHSRSGLLPTNFKINDLGKKKCAVQKQMPGKNSPNWQNSGEAWNMERVSKCFTYISHWNPLSTEIVVSDARHAVLSDHTALFQWPLVIRMFSTTAAAAVLSASSQDFEGSKCIASTGAQQCGL